MNNLVESLEKIRLGAEEILLEQELEQYLKDSIAAKKPLKVKAGFDPSAPDIHLGHTVLLNKLKQFQDLGHEVCFIIGDFTGMIGDPTGKNITRRALTKDEVLENAKTYQQQAFKILNPEKTKILFNSKWIEELGTKGLVELAGKYTVARMLEREDFHKRYTQNQAISIHEFLYPLLQGFDSVHIAADIELGGTDQKFNLLVGRELQKHYKQRPQVVMTFPLLEGLDGVQKMSKSLNNYIGITESPKEMFGKIMSISDSLMWRYFDLLSFRAVSELKQLKQSVEEGMNPRDAKFLLAEEIITRFHSSQAAKEAKEGFIAQFQKGAMPEDIKDILVKVPRQGLPIANVLKEAGLISSTSEGLRLIQEGGVRIDNEKITDKSLLIRPGFENIVQVGKRRFAKILAVESAIAASPEAAFPRGLVTAKVQNKPEHETAPHGKGKAE